MTNPCLIPKHGKNIIWKVHTAYVGPVGAIVPRARLLLPSMIPCVKLMFDGITFLILLHVSNVLCMLFAC